MDIWVNFTNATRPQAECIFKQFFPPGPSASSSGVPILEEAEIARLAERFADEIPEGEMSVWPALLSRLASVLIPKCLQVASLQGYLLKNKSRPRACVEEVAEWCGLVIQVVVTGVLTLIPNRVRQEREARVRIQRE